MQKIEKPFSHVDSWEGGDFTRKHIDDAGKLRRKSAQTENCNERT